MLIQNEHHYREVYHELQGLVDLILDLPQELRGTPMVEIGSYTGDSTLVFSTFFGHVVSVDPHIYVNGKDLSDKWTPADVKKKYLENINNRSITYINKRSEKAVADVLKLLPSGCNFIYIDGGHAYEQVIKDIAAYWPLVMYGGVLAGHDYDCKDLPGVKKAVDELFGAPDKEYIDGSWLIYKTIERKLNHGQAESAI